MPGSASGPTNQGATAGAARSTLPCHSAPGKADEGGARVAVPTGSRFAGGQRLVNACTRRDVTPPLCTASRPTRSGTLMRPEGPHACRLLSPALRASVGLASLPTRAGDALTLLKSEVEGGADGAAPSKSSKATPNHFGATRSCAEVRIDRGHQHRRRIAGRGTLRRRPRIARRQRTPRSLAREGDYADPHTSEESPRIMARRRGRRARRTTP